MHRGRNGPRTAANFRRMINFKSAEYDWDYDNDMANFLRDYGAKSPTNSLATGNDVIPLTPPEPTDENLTSG